MTAAMCSSSGMPISSAPLTISSRRTPFANALSFIFFLTDATSTSASRFVGLTSATAITNPLSSSAANRAFSTRMEKALFAADELSGFVIAVALVRPTKRLADVDVASVKKKMKDKAFAKGVRREDIVKGAEEMGMPLEEHIAAVIAALQGIAPELGLDGVGC